MEYSTLSDEKLMLKYGEGDARAFDTLYGRHKGPMYRYVVRQVTDLELANDLYQDLWGRIIRSSAAYKKSAKWTTWAYRIAHNLVIDHYRTFKPVEPEVEAISSETPPSLHEQKELSQQLSHCMGKLPAVQREVFLLTQETDLNLSMISEVVSVSHEAVKSRLRYAKSSLKDCLARFGVIPTHSARASSSLSNNSANSRRRT